MRAITLTLSRTEADRLAALAAQVRLPRRIVATALLGAALQGVDPPAWLREALRREEPTS